MFQKTLPEDDNIQVKRRGIGTDGAIVLSPWDDKCSQDDWQITDDDEQFFKAFALEQDHFALLIEDFKNGKLNPQNTRQLVGTKANLVTEQGLAPAEEIADWYAKSLC